MVLDAYAGEGRPLPEDLLVVSHRAEQKAHEGRLTVYLGYAAGVGKTYAMLYDALQRRKEGVDIVTGYVETHGRPETDALVARLEAIPPIFLEYQGIHLREPDLDAILQRRPQIVLIDELAHTNAPDVRHVKRYQDIEELLHAGISVYTTINIQHIESQNDAVAQITGIRVSETVPDKFFADADEIRLIDITPEELKLRLKSGKVYVKDMAEAAIQRFFRTGNLLALRQLALRYMALATDQQMIDYMRARAISGPWPAAERLLVGIRAGPTAEQMVRAAYRLAARFNADWVVLSVDIESDMALTHQEHTWLNKALETGRRLGGRIVRYHGEDVSDEILRYARRNNVTMIMLGKPHGIDILFSPVYRIIRESRGIDIFLYEQKDSLHIPLKKQILPRIFSRDYVASLILILAVAGINLILRNTVSPKTLLAIQLLPIFVSAFFFRRVALFVAAVSIILFDLLFVTPYYSLTIDSWQYFVLFVGYVVFALLISGLATRLRHLLDQVWRSEAEVEAVSGLSRDLAEAGTRQEVFSILTSHLKGFAQDSFAVLVPGPSGLRVRFGDAAFPLTDKELSIAQWAYDNGQEAGKGTDNLPAGKAYFLPLKAHEMVFGILAFAFDKPEEMLTAENKEILETMAFLGALALERVE